MVSSLSMRGGVKFSSPMAGAMKLLLGRTTQTGRSSSSSSSSLFSLKCYVHEGNKLFNSFTFFTTFNFTGRASELKLAEASIGLVLRRGVQNILPKEFNEILKTGTWMEWISTTWTQLQQQFGVEATRIQALVAPMLWQSL